MAVTDHQRLEWSSALRANLEQLTTLHDIIQERIDKLEQLEKGLEEALGRVEREKSEEGDALGSLQRASEDAVRRARLVGVKLEASFLEGEIPEESYRAVLAAAYPRGSQSIGPTPALRVEALRRIAAALEQHGAADPDGALKAVAIEGADAIDAANTDAKREQQETQEATAQLTGARGDFDEGYLATKEIVGGLLRDAKRLGELRDVFPDL